MKPRIPRANTPPMVPPMIWSMRWLLLDAVSDDDAFVAIGADVEIGEGGADAVDEVRTELVAECREGGVDDKDVAG